MTHATVLEPISKSFEEYDEASELQEAKEILRIELPSDKNAALPLNPGEESFDHPSPGVSPKSAPILRGRFATTGSMAAATGFSHTTIRRIWTAFGLQPHRSQTFKLSSDPLFVDKVRDIVGLYLSPPNRALVLSVDEKSQIQALDREQPVLPMMPGIPERRTHSYVRHGTTSLFAALDVASGFVIGKCYKCHRATEFLDFLKQIDAQVWNSVAKCFDFAGAP
jgi:hypothetical protein